MPVNIARIIQAFSQFLPLVGDVIDAKNAVMALVKLIKTKDLPVKADGTPYTRKEIADRIMAVRANWARQADIQ